SLDAVELIMAIEEEFDTTIPDDVAQNIRKVKDIVSFLESLN
ncbi:MAG TPA: phosphopantetheine-binding protein, partial [Bacilli bacterium]